MSTPSWIGCETAVIELSMTLYARRRTPNCSDGRLRRDQRPRDFGGWRATAFLAPVSLAGKGARAQPVWPLLAEAQLPNRSEDTHSRHGRPRRRRAAPSCDGFRFSISTHVERNPETAEFPQHDLAARAVRLRCNGTARCPDSRVCRARQSPLEEQWPKPVVDYTKYFINNVVLPARRACVSNEILHPRSCTWPQRLRPYAHWFRRNLS